MTTASILTPDQRLRVFVSSTLQELAEERQAAKAAIEDLHLNPVMFELGARPHPPRALYRAYLEQSHVFVGIYWQRYGWIAPGEEISGLEDEYRLSGGRPKLIYVKTPAPEREDRLGELLERIRNDDQASYKQFSTPEELKRLLADDLALLLSERFAAPPTPAPAPPRSNLAAPPTVLVGRNRELDELYALQRSGTRLLTLVGPGGVGKSRLALALAQRVAHHYADGVFFVPLAPLRNSELVPETIAQSLGFRIEELSAADGLGAYLRDRQVLLVLDNFEQVGAAAPWVSDLLRGAPRLAVIVTSRETLHLSGEQVYPVPPLSLEPAGPADDPAAQSEAVRLFVARAQAVRPDFRLAPDNASVIADICARLEGLPLAIELAAARLRLLTPRALLDRLDHRFELLSDGARDLPPRQRTLRDTVDWSFELLSEDEQALFMRLGACAGGCSLEAAEALGQGLGGDLLEGLTSLLDKSLIGRHDEDGAPRFTMLETLREYARERLEASGQLSTVRRLHADHFTDYAERLGPELRGRGQRAASHALELEHDNVRAAMRWALDEDELDHVARLAWALWVAWWMNAHTSEAHRWLQEALRSERAGTLGTPSRAKLLGAAGILSFWQGDYAAATPLLEQGLPLSRELGDQQDEAYLLLALGAIATSQGMTEQAQDRLERSLALMQAAEDDWGTVLVYNGMARNAFRQGALERALALFEVSSEHGREVGDGLTRVITLSGRAGVALKQQNAPLAATLFRESLEISRDLHYLEGIAWSLEGLSVAAALERRLERASRLFAAAEALREVIHTPSWAPETQIMVEQAKRQLLHAGEDDGRLASARAEGRAMELEEAIDYAREGREEG